MSRIRERQSSRRAFLQSSAASGLLYVTPKIAFGSQSNSAIEIGIIGCGGRGVYIGNFFVEHTGARIAALADPLPDNIAALQASLHATSARTYTGLNGYRELLNSKLDAIVIESPPYFHPEQAAAGVDAGKHVFVAKPIAVDVPGCQSIEESANKAKGRLSFLVDLQTRSRPAFREAVERIRRGDIGTPVMAQVSYHNGEHARRTRAGDTELQNRLRNWNLDRKLSGEIIVEQDIHMIDVANWFIGAHPVEANGTGGRAPGVRPGDMLDYFLVHYTYPGGIQADAHFTRFASAYRDLSVRLQGTKGTAEAHYMGSVGILGPNAWKGEESDQTRQGAVTNVKNFVESIRTGRYLNNAAEASQSNLSAILGRISTYRRKPATWDQMMREAEKLDAQLKG